MDLKTLIPILVQASLFLLVLGVGMRSSWRNLTYAFRKPGNLGRAMIAVNVVVPMTAVLLAALLPVDWTTKAGLLVMAVSPLAPFATGKMMKASADQSYDVGLYAALVLLAVIIVPLTVAFLNPFYDRHATISVGEVGWFVIKSVLIPLSAGVTIATIWPAFAERAAPIATTITYAIIIPLAVLFLIKSGSQFLGLLGDGTMAVIVGTIAAGLAAGHWLGGPDPGHRAALAQAAATRHPGIAVLIAKDDFGGAPEVMIAILLFLLTSVVMTLLYGKWARKRYLKDAQR